MIDEAACARIITAILADEGGVADVGDGAGVTRWGQTLDWLSDWGLPTPHTPPEAAQNYRTWLRATRLDELTGYSEGMAHLVIDSAVNQGLSFAVRALQAAVLCPQDGVIGQVTLNSVAHADPIRIGFKVGYARQMQYIHLAQAQPEKYEQFLSGWTARLWRLLPALVGGA